jgi:8-oxo-dGTP pyrophosphatase MutT (NUDIX family)
MQPDRFQAFHLDENEAAKQAMIRRAKEEAGIDIKRDDLTLVCIVNQKYRWNDQLIQLKDYA